MTSTSNEIARKGKNSAPPAWPDLDPFYAALPPSVEVPVELIEMHVPVEVADSIEYLTARLQEVPPKHRETAQVSVVEYAGANFCRVTVTYMRMAHSRRITSSDLRRALQRV